MSLRSLVYGGSCEIETRHEPKASLNLPPAVIVLMVEGEVRVWPDLLAVEDDRV